MSERVLSTDTAKQAISQMQTIINGGFQEQIQQLNRQGEVLSDPNNWDGPLASQFRGSWQDTPLSGGWKAEKYLLLPTHFSIYF